MTPTVVLPAHALRALHSAYVDYLIGLPEPIRDAFIQRTGGASFDRFVLGLQAHQLGVTARTVDDSAFLGIAVPVVELPDLALFEIAGKHAGVDADYLVRVVMDSVDVELVDLLGGVE